MKPKNPRDEQLTDELARIFGWKSMPDRFLKPNRSWIPHWRSAPVTNLENAFDLLDAAASAYTLGARRGGIVKADVHVNEHVGGTYGAAKPRTITIALARALGLDLSAEDSAPISRAKRPDGGRG